MFKLLLSFVFIILITSSFAQSDEKKEVDSLLQIIKRSKNDSIIMDAYNKLRRATYYSNSEKSLNYTKKFLEYAQKNKYPLETAIGQFYMGNAYVTQSEYPKALNYYLKSADYFERLQDSTRLSSVLNGIGAAYEKNGNDSLSLKYFLKAHYLAEKMGDHRRDALALNNVANIYKRREKIKKALYYQQKAVANLTPNDVPYYGLVQTNLGNILIDDNQTQQAKQILEEVLKTCDFSEDILTFINAKKSLGFIAIEEEDYTKAVGLMEEAYFAATENEFFEQRYDLMGELIKLYSYTGQNKKGLDLSFVYSNIRDSIFSDERDKNLSEAIQKYESAKKDKSIAEQKLTIQKEQRTRNWVIFGAIALALFALLIYFFLRKRLKYQNLINKQSEKLQQQKIAEMEQEIKVMALNSMIEGQEAERARIAKDLHDGLGGLLSTVKSHFSSISIISEGEKYTKIYNKTNDLIDEACLEVRRISHNMMPHSLTILSLEDVIIDLGESLQQDGIKTTIEISKIPFILDDTKKIMIYRLIQELISNIRKHAKANNVLLQLFIHGGTMTFTIEDDGVGFDKNDAYKKDGLGVKSIFSRIQYLNGKIDYDCQVGKGCSVTLQIPLP